MQESALKSIAGYVHDKAGLCFAGHKHRLLRQRLEERLLQLNLSDLNKYSELLFRSPSESECLLELLTTNETSFFRNPRQFEYLMECIIPALEEEKGKTAIRSWGANALTSDARLKLRILCAGCSTGEEPYSVAMALLARLRYPRAWDIEILAGDLNESCIRAAETGYYEEERLRGLSDAFRDKFTERVAGGIEIRPEVKKLVRFTVMNLNDIVNGEKFPGNSTGNAGFDMIFCRNVLIYFSLHAQQLLIDLLYHSLVPGGYLFTGDAEPLHLYSHDFQTVKDARCLIYRKTEINADVNTD